MSDKNTDDKNTDIKIGGKLMIDKNNRKEVLKEAKSICKEYTANRKTVEEWGEEKARLEELADSCLEPEKKVLINDIISFKKSEAGEALRKMLVFETALAMCDSKTAHIMRQLYIERKSWDNVCNVKGKKISRGTISKERKKGMAAIVELLNNELWRKKT